MPLGELLSEIPIRFRQNETENWSLNQALWNFLSTQIFLRCLRKNKNNIIEPGHVTNTLFIFGEKLAEVMRRENIFVMKAYRSQGILFFYFLFFTYPTCFISSRRKPSTDKLHFTAQMFAWDLEFRFLNFVSCKFPFSN